MAKVNTKNTKNKKASYIAIAILLFTVSFLIILALLSYSRADEAIAQMSIKDISSLLFGNELVKAKVALARNLLGLTGSIISYFFFYHIIGIFSIVFPLICILIAKDLFFAQRINDKTIKISSFYLLIAFLISVFFGAVSRISWIGELPKEFYGSVGYFSSSLFTGLIGAFGSSLLILAIIVFAFVFTSRLKINTDKIKSISDDFADKTKEKFGTIKDNISDSFRSDNKEEIQESEPETKVKESIISDEDKLEDEPQTFVSKTISPIKIVKRSIISEEKEAPKAEADLTSNKEEISEEAIQSPETNSIEENQVANETEKIEELEESNSISLENYDEEEVVVSTAEFDTDDEEEIEIESESKIEAPKTTQKVEEPKSLPPTDNKPLEVSINKSKSVENQFDDFDELNFPLGNEIHDEEIKYTKPTIDLLIDNHDTEEVNDDELKMNARILQEKLETFKIYIENLTVTPGPVVTQYEFVPAEGIKVSKIESLSDDLAMALKSKGIRIIAPIPGKGTVGVEIPNSKRSMVRFKDIVTSQKYNESRYKLPLALGKSISGEVILIDLAKMPHLLIAGSTGSGKSVGINTIIASLVYKLHPSQLKFIMIDPKKVELPQYSMLRKHFMAMSPEVKDNIVTNPVDAVIVLKATVAEMEKRYDILAHVGQRNIDDYNSKVDEGKYKNDAIMEHRKMPYIVVIIDELADLMLTASKEIEEPIIRLAQMARAVGIHLIIATQRPSVDVITGIIKANFPARIAYTVRTRIDSRTILDMGGAENLIGQGDMLCLAAGQSEPIRVQNSFLDTDETEAICEFIGKQQGYSTPYMLPSLNEKKEEGGSLDKSDRDPLFEEAARLIIRNQQGSVSLIQRRLKVGYARAGRIVDELEDAGVVGPFDGSKARQVLMESESELERVL